MPDVNPVNPWIPVIAAAIGGALAILGGMVTQWWTAKREHESREHERKERRERQRADFQIKTLLDLQDATKKLLSTTGSIINANRKKSNEKGAWGCVQIYSGIGQKHRDLTGEIISDVARVEDESIRNLYIVVINYSIKMASARSEEEVEKASEDFMQSFRSANDRLGEVLRSLY